MNKPVISENFTIEDIHKIRVYNRETTENMSFEERKAYYESGATTVLKRIELLKTAREETA